MDISNVFIMSWRNRGYIEIVFALRVLRKRTCKSKKVEIIFCVEENKRGGKKSKGFYPDSNSGKGPTE